MQTVTILGRITRAGDDPAGLWRIAIPKAHAPVFHRRSAFRRRGLGETPSPASTVLPAVILAIGIPLGYWWITRTPRRKPTAADRQRQRRISQRSWAAQ